MKTINSLLQGFVAAAAWAAISSANAAYPTRMTVDVEMWNDTSKDLGMTAATWVSQPSSLAGFAVPAGNAGVAFQVILNNPRDDAGSFRYMNEDGKVCEFKFSHKTTFSWFGLNPAPKKFASGQSIGTVAAQCDASVIKGTNSMSGYTVRYVMR